MKKLFLSLLINSLFVFSANARPLASEPGWESTISVNAGVVSSQSHLSFSDDDTIDSLNESADSTTNVIAFPFARLQYTTKDLNTQFFLGNSREQISISQFQYELGVTHQFQNKTKFTVAYFPNLPLLNETWQDPYLVNQDRSETDKDAQGGRLELANLAGSPLTLKYAFALTKIENDSSGEGIVSLSEQQLQTLQRSSQYHRVTAEMMFPIRRGLLIRPGLQYTSRIADGDAVSYDDYDLQLGFLVFNGRHSTITTLNVGTTKYKQSNPIFDEKQNSLNMGIFSVYAYKQPFDWESTTFTLIAGYNQKNSDITFHDESGLILTTGLAYTF